MGVLDKFRIKGVVKTRFNPGRNANWDWNDLLTTIEANFEGDFDLPALEARAVQNTADIAANDVDIATVTAQATANANQVATNLVSITDINTQNTCLCTLLAAAIEGEDYGEFQTAMAAGLATCCSE
tara:strand:- start:297 stop:677 length:381 start_codon:yes stop_codon:yes gene_type:complete